MAILNVKVFDEGFETDPRIIYQFHKPVWGKEHKNMDTTTLAL